MRFFVLVLPQRLHAFQQYADTSFYIICKKKKQETEEDITEEVEEVQTEEESIITEEIIADAKVALAGKGEWALFNLISMTASVIIALSIALKGSGKEEGRNTAGRLTTVIIAVTSLVVFFLTEDLSNQMVLADSWTAIMVTMLAATAAMALITRNRKENKEENMTVASF